MRCLAAGLVLSLACAGLTAKADISGLPEATRSTLEARATGMTAALLTGDAEGLFDFLPPPLIAQMAALLGQSPAEFRARFIDNLENNRPGTGITEHRLDLSGATLFQGDDGLSYVMVPTKSRAFDPFRGKFRVSGTTVAIPASDTWHFFTISDVGALDLLVAAYPALADAPLVPVTLTPEP